MSAVAGTAADAGQTALTAGNASGPPELATVAAADAWDATLATGAAFGTTVDATRTAVTVGIATAAARVQGDEVSNAGAGGARPRRNNIG
ncbi:hypothetical protein A5636_16440 [Mycobacterium asiaticum]|uniref:Uncharacterized protein n=1 Tax=Mycobacterium asiaticum TaxID=1790 RepID=A0A1A3MM95_MYCAS|nr:hypothetical protein A5636_16440 [Mycobacterium asiaticum]